MLVAAARTPFGKLGGGLSTLAAPDLGAVVIKEVLARAKAREPYHQTFCPRMEAIMAYTLEGDLLEVCNCDILCPCWVGEDPDYGTCDGVLSWQVDKGTVNGVDVSGHNLTILTHIPGNILQGNCLRADVASAERVVVVTAYVQTLVGLNSDFDAADRFAEIAGAIVRGAISGDHHGEFGESLAS